MNTNPIIELTNEQTSQFLTIWDQQKPVLSPGDYLFGKVKLNRSQAKLTKNQLYRMMMTLAESGYIDIPEWLLVLTDPQELK
jgi:hypothetical protein